MSAAQPALDLPPPRPADGRADFIVVPGNSAALAMIDGWRDWPDGRLCLTGPPGCGKSHLAAVWSRETGAVRIDTGDLTTTRVPALAATGFLALEDAERVGGRAEEALFHLINLMMQSGGRLLLTARTPPVRWNAALPDLASRLSATAIARLDPPDDDLLRAVLAKHFTDRQLRVEDRVVDFLVARMERSFAAAAALADRLDRESLARRRPITRALAREALAGDEGV